MPSYKLTYFPFTGLGEPIRMAFAAAGVPFEDERVAFADFPARKATLPNGQMPVLTVKDDSGKETQMPQCRAILRYLGKVLTHDGAKMYPDDPLAAYKVDEIIDLVEDLRGTVSKTFAIADEAEKKKARAALMAEGGAMVPWVERLESHVGTGPFILGEHLSVADIYTICLLNMVRAPSFVEGVLGGWLEKYPNLWALKERVVNLPTVKEYYKGKDGEYVNFQPAQAPVLCGGVSAARAVDPEVQALVDGLRDAALQKAQASGWNGLFTKFEALEVKSQVVAGTNYFVKVAISDRECVHVRIHQPLPHTGKPAELHGIKVAQDHAAQLDFF